MDWVLLFSFFFSLSLFCFSLSSLPDHSLHAMYALSFFILEKIILIFFFSLPYSTGRFTLHSLLPIIHQMWSVSLHILGGMAFWQIEDNRKEPSLFLSFSLVVELGIFFERTRTCTECSFDSGSIEITSFISLSCFPLSHSLFLKFDISSVLHLRNS